MATRRTFSSEFKREAVRLVKDCGLAITQAARDLDLHENVLRKWVRELGADPQHAFPGQGQMKPEQAEIERWRREYNEERPKKALGGLTPAAYAKQLK
jgi:transposase